MDFLKQWFHARDLLAIPNFEDPMTKPAQLRVLVALMALETLAVFAYLIWLIVIPVIAGEEKSLALIASLGAVVAVFAIWLVFVTKGLWQLKSWARSAAVFWQTVQLAIAYGSFSGQFAQPAIGWALIIPSAVVFYLMFSKPLSQLLKREL
jgi:hypothetical protein